MIYTLFTRRKEPAGFFAVQFNCLLGVVLDECFRFDKNIAAKREGSKDDEDDDYFFVKVIINFSD